ncbi:MAG: winged helix-turn-helix transcriptional regulator [Candidatus Hydrogenedentota bacterium]|nr:MAG: winged helix-turn-helix transcriptional regulator [Candidatus Hydrogenedentota bacterium]
MTPERLRELIQRGESLNVEFKGEPRGPLSDEDIVKAVVCMANRPSSESGWILIGVKDDGGLTGARPRHGQRTDPLLLQAMIANRTNPSLSVRVFVVPLVPEGMEVIAVEVPPVRGPVGTTDGVYLRRALGGRGEPICLPMQPADFQSLQSSRGLLDYCGLVVDGASWEDLDPLEFERFRRFVQENPGQSDSTLLRLPDWELAKALGAVEANHKVTRVRVLGLLLFGKEASIQRFLPTLEVAFQVLRGQQVEVNEFFRFPLLRVMEEVLQRFRARYREEELMMGLLRVGVPEYSERAFREAVANALIHRDYTRLGAVHIQWYEDYLVISNPGGFPEGVRLDNILVTPPKPRNPLLADAFKRAGLVERTGRGIDIIFTEQLRTGRPAPSYARSTPTDVVLVLYGGKANLEFVRLVGEEQQAGRLVGLDELLILNALWQERSLTTPQVAALLQKPEPDARAVLERLVERGLLEARGERKGRTYHLSAATYRRLGVPSAYVRRRGFEPIQQEQMILQYIERFGSISRKEAAELCRLSPMQAYRLLKRLESEGKIQKLGGSTKGVRYARSRK